MIRKYYVCAKIRNKWYILISRSLPLVQARIAFQDYLLIGFQAGYTMGLRTGGLYDEDVVKEFKQKVQTNNFKFWA